MEAPQPLRSAQLGESRKDATKGDQELNSARHGYHRPCNDDTGENELEMRRSAYISN